MAAVLVAAYLLPGSFTKIDGAAAARADRAAAEQFMTGVARIDECTVVDMWSTFTPICC